MPFNPELSNLELYQGIAAVQTEAEATAYFDDLVTYYVDHDKLSRELAVRVVKTAIFNWAYLLFGQTPRTSEIRRLFGLYRGKREWLK